MINFNGKLIAEEVDVLSIDNRSFKYGDGVFETIKVKDEKIIFSEDHYFRLMASLRLFRINIPMDFTLEKFEDEIAKLIKAKKINKARVRVTCFRNDGGLYTPMSNEMNFVIEASELNLENQQNFEVDLYKDFYNYSGHLSSIKSTNRALNVLASIYAKENDLNSCLLLNERKFVCESISGNIFLIFKNTIVTPPISEGCIKGIIRKKVIEIISKSADFELEERAISPFELKKADEAFITNSIVGIQPIAKYRKKTFIVEKSKQLLEMLLTEE